MDPSAAFEQTARMVRGGGWSVLVVAVLVAGCSGGGADPEATPAGSESGVPEPAGTGDADDVATASTSTTAVTSSPTTTAVSTTTTTTVPARTVRIEDAVVDPRGVVRMASHFQGLHPDDSRRRACVLKWTSDDSDRWFAPSPSARYLAIMGCEYPSEAEAAVAAEEVRAAYSPDDPSEVFEALEPFADGRWTGREGSWVTGDGVQRGFIEMTTQHGLRVFSAVAADDVIDGASAYAAMAADLVAAQEAHLVAADIGVETAGAWFEDQGARVSPADVVMGSDDLAAAVGAELTGSDTWYDRSIVDSFDARSIETGGRWGAFDRDGSPVEIRVTATLFRHPIDAVLAVEAATLSGADGEAPGLIRESASVDGGVVVAGSTWGGSPQASAHLVAGSRHYRVDVEPQSESESVSQGSEDDAALADRVLAGLVDFLDRNDLMEPPGVVEPVALRPDGLVATALAEHALPERWSLQRMTIGFDDWTGAPLFDVTVQAADIETTRAVIGVGMPPDEFVSAFAPGVRDLDPGAWTRWAAVDPIKNRDDPRERWLARSVWVDGDISLVVEPGHIDELSEQDALSGVDRYRDRLDVWLDIADSLRAALPPGVSAESVDAEQRVLRVLGEATVSTSFTDGRVRVPDSPFTANTVLAYGGVTGGSPGGADADWHVIVDDSPSYGRNETRLLHFVDEAAAAAYVDEVTPALEGGAAGSINGADASATGFDASGAGRAVAARGVWVAEIVIRDGSWVAETLDGLSADVHAAEVVAEMLDDLRHWALVV